MAEYLGISLPEINVVDFQKSGYLPQALVNFVALLGWNPGGDNEIFTIDELIESFDPKRFSKTNSLFDRNKLLSFNTEHMKMLSAKKLLGYFKDYLKINSSPLAQAGDQLLARCIDLCQGARTLADIEIKCNFLIVDDNKIQYDQAAVKKVLLKGEKHGLEMLKVIREKFVATDSIDADQLEQMLRGLAEEKGAGLGKVAQPLRVAITGSTVSPAIFDSIDLLGMDRTIARIDKALEKFC